MNISQRIGKPLVHLPPKVTFNVSQLAPAASGSIACTFLFPQRVV